MFHIYSFRIDEKGKACYHCFHRNITHEEAKELAKIRNANPNRSVKYFIVSENNINKFINWAEATAKPFREKYIAQEMRKKVRAEYASKMAWQGYKCADAIAFIKG